MVIKRHEITFLEKASIHPKITRLYLYDEQATCCTYWFIYMDKIGFFCLNVASNLERCYIEIVSESCTTWQQTSFKNVKGLTWLVYDMYQYARSGEGSERNRSPLDCHLILVSLERTPIESIQWIDQDTQFHCTRWPIAKRIPYIMQYPTYVALAFTDMTKNHGVVHHLDGGLQDSPMKRSCLACGSSQPSQIHPGV